MEADVRVWLDAPGTLDQRQDARHNVLWLARIRTEDGAVRCVVIDISRHGVRLQLEAPILGESILPRPPITLFIEPLGPRWADLVSFGALRGEIAWQHGCAMGIHFTVDPQRAAAIIDTALLF